MRRKVTMSNLFKKLNEQKEILNIKESVCISEKDENKMIFEGLYDFEAIEVANASKLTDISKN